MSERTNWKAKYGYGEQEMLDTALFLLRLGSTDEETREALRKNFPPDFNLDLVMSRAVKQVHDERQRGDVI